MAEALLTLTNVATGFAPMLDAGHARVGLDFIAQLAPYAA